MDLPPSLTAPGVFSCRRSAISQGHSKDRCVLGFIQMRTRLSLFVQIQGRIGVPIFSRDEQMHGKVISFVALVGRPLGRSTIDPLPRIGRGRSRDPQKWDGPCEVAIIAALNKFGTLLV